MIRSDKGGDSSTSAPIVIIFWLLLAHFGVHCQKTISHNHLIVIGSCLRNQTGSKTKRPFLYTLAETVRQEASGSYYTNQHSTRKRTNTRTNTYLHAHQRHRRIQSLRFPPIWDKLHEHPRFWHPNSRNTSIVILHPCIEQLYALIPFASWESQVLSVNGLSRNAPIFFYDYNFKHKLKPWRQKIGSEMIEISRTDSIFGFLYSTHFEYGNVYLVETHFSSIPVCIIRISHSIRPIVSASFLLYCITHSRFLWLTPFSKHLFIILIIPWLTTFLNRFLLFVSRLS